MARRAQDEPAERRRKVGSMGGALPRRGLVAAWLVLAVGWPAGFVLAADPDPLSAPALDDLPSFGWAFVKMILVLAAILVGLLLLAKLVLPRLGFRPAVGRSTVIEIVEGSRLEPRKNVYLIRVAGQYLLVGTSENGVHTLAGGPLDQEAIARDLETARSAAGGGNAAGGSETSKRSFVDLLRRGR